MNPVVMTNPREEEHDTAAIRPTLLAVSPVPPWPATDGMSLRVSKMLEELAKKWSIVLACPPGGASGVAAGVPLAAEIRLARSGAWMYLPSQYDVRPVVNAITEAIRVHQPSVAILWGGMEYLHHEIQEMPPTVSDRVDCMTLSAWRMLLHARGPAMRWRRLSHLVYVARYEFRMRRDSAGTVVVGDTDAKVLRRIGVRNVHVIPNGVDVPTVALVRRATRPTVMFTGVLSYQPNADAVMHFADDIWPLVQSRLPDAVFQIVGRSPSKETIALGSRSGVEVHADVESVQASLAQAWLAVAPMRTGSGLKNKILEAWSVGTPAVMTPIATNGLVGAPTSLLLTAEGTALASLVVDLLTDPERLAELGALARVTALKNFSWKSQAAALDAILDRAAAR
ncbi:MAG TPA: glycosyltransferase family 4 protein [Gemmatimonadaceae bacterium]|jgi:glycosyltransferase involved in cell wall biosynthesis|nr:glycosyltransferase family 4 protein [Gemmatimonadaceae bacterium]